MFFFYFCMCGFGVALLSSTVKQLFHPSPAKTFPTQSFLSPPAVGSSQLGQKSSFCMHCFGDSENHILTWPYGKKIIPRRLFCHFLCRSFCSALLWKAGSVLQKVLKPARFHRHVSTFSTGLSNFNLVFSPFKHV